MSNLITRIILKLARNNQIKISDKKYLTLMGKLRLGVKIDLEKPKTFSEKIQWLKLYDRNPDYIKMVDKYEAKQYVSGIIGGEYIIPTLGIYNDFEEIDFDKLPDQFVMKPTHTSGDIFICKDKNKIQYEELKNTVHKWLKRNYYILNKEWPYKNIKPRIIIEKYMKDPQQEDLKDYKFMCFNGKVKCSFVCSNRNAEGGLKVDFYDLDWNKMPFSRYYPNSDKEIEKPINYHEMIRLSEKLANGIPFVRVDFYEIGGKIFFGEMTFYPGAGFEKFEPERYDRILGDMLELPKEKREEK